MSCASGLRSRRTCAASPRAGVKRTLTRIEALRDEPRGPGCEKLSGAEVYRVRQGVCRIVYEIRDTHVVVEVIRVE